MIGVIGLAPPPRRGHRDFALATQATKADGEFPPDYRTLTAPGQSPPAKVDQCLGSWKLKFKLLRHGPDRLVQFASEAAWLRRRGLHVRESAWGQRNLA